MSSVEPMTGGVDPYAYAATHGPRAGDRVRLGDSGLTIRVESDAQKYGDEFLMRLRQDRP